MKVHLAYFSGICLHLFAISISADKCLDGPDGTDCIFYHGLCAWKSELWKNYRNRTAALDTNKNPRGNMKSKKLCSTNTETHCLLFDYEFRFQRYKETKLSVLLHEDDTAKQTIWRLRSYTTGTYPAKVPLSAKNSFKIEFKVHRIGTSMGVGSFVMIDTIRYNSSKCELEPVDANPGRKIKPTKPFTEKPKVTKTATTKLTKPFTMKPTPRITRTTATTTTRASPTTTKQPRTSSRTSEQKTHIMTVSEKMTLSTTSEKMSKSQQRSTSPNPMKGSRSTISTPDSAGNSQAPLVGTIVAAVVGVIIVICVIVFVLKRKYKKRQTSNDQGNQPRLSNQSDIHLEPINPDNEEENRDYEDIPDVPPANPINPYSNVDNASRLNEVPANQGNSYDILTNENRDNNQYDILFADRRDSAGYELPVATPAHDRASREQNRHHEYNN